MKVIIILFAITIAAAAAFNFTTKQVPEGPQPTDADDSLLNTEDPMAQVEPTGLADSTSSGDSDPLAETEDPIARELFNIIHDLVTGKVSESDEKTLRSRLARALGAAKLADESATEAAAATGVDSILREFVRYGASSGGSVTRIQEDAFLGVAEKYAAKLKRGLAYGGLNMQHDGVFVSSSLDVALPEGYSEAPWGVLGGFEWRDDMTLPEGVRALAGKKVGIAGYMMAMGEFEDIHNFLLVESQWSCCFGVPPEVHQVIIVTIPDDEPGVELVNVPIVILGDLEVGQEKEDGWVTSVYRLSANAVEILE